jgi:Lon protease (S16) C-terminal proteolytic domain
MAAALAFGGCGGGGQEGVTVKALWYGTTQAGTTVGGVSAVDISAVDDSPETPLSVDLRGLRAEGAGPMWRAATAVAAVQAVLVAGVDPRRQQLRYSVHEAIDGPSAGALLTVGSLAALRGAPLAADTTTMTGTVLPDGSVGPVAGILEKLRAAASAGITHVLIPNEPRRFSSPDTGWPVDPVRFGRSLGLTVTRVTSVPGAYAAMTEEPEGAPPTKAPPLPPGLTRMLERRSRALIGASTGPASKALVRTAEGALADGDSVLAFAAAAEAAQRARQAAALARLRASAGSATVAGQAARLERSAARSLRSIRARVRAAAELPVTKVAQLTALSDALSWGAFATTSIEIAEKRLGSVRTEAELEEIVAFVETARFEARNYMPACVESLRFLGRQRITPHTVDLIEAYARLIDYAANANQRYADSLGVDRTASHYLRELLDEANEDDRAQAAELRSLRGPTAAPALRLSVALLKYVESTQLVNDLTFRDSAALDEPPNLAPIKDPETVLAQARTAAAITSEELGGLAAAGLDPAFVQWNSRWGADLAFGRLPNAGDEQRLHGLQFQWFAVLQSQLLAALSH